MDLKFKEGINFLTSVRKLQKPPSKIAVIDKTKFYSNSHGVKHLNTMGSGRPRRLKLLRGSPLCMYSMLVADGTLGPFYLETSVKKYAEFGNAGTRYGFIKYLKKKEFRRGEAGYLAYLQTCVDHHYLNPGDLLLSDNESSFKTEKVKNFLEKNQIHYLYFPSYLNHLMNPCDNYFHASIKRKYWRSVDNLKNLPFQKKVDLIRNAFFSENETSIVKYFENCGIIGNTKPNDVLKHLFSEGLFPAKKFKFMHNQQLEDYIKWKTNGKLETLHDFLGVYYPNNYLQK